jgi:hypothetical protein
LYSFTAQPRAGEISDSRLCIKSRQIFGFLGFLGFALVYAMRVNLSVAIVSMVNQSAIPHTDNESDVDACPKINPVNTTFVPVSLLNDIDDKILKLYILSNHYLSKS